MTTEQDSDVPIYAQHAAELANLCHQLRPNVPRISASEFVRRSRQAEWRIVDVRSPRERNVSIIPGALSREDFEAQIEEHAKAPILVYCVAGCKSGAYAKELRKRGFEAFNLQGGVLAWALEGRTFVTPDGEPTRRVSVRGIPWDVLPPDYDAVR